MSFVKTGKSDYSEPFNLNFTLKCGQVFRWQYGDGWWYGVTYGCLLRLRQDWNNEKILYETSANLIGEKEAEEFLWDYFRFNDKLGRIYQQLQDSYSKWKGDGVDSDLKRAFEKFRGLRLIRQEPWECLISYMCATGVKIQITKRMIEQLSRNFGYHITNDYYAFPSPEQLLSSDLSSIQNCVYKKSRAEAILGMSNIISKKPNFFDALRKTDLSQLRSTLIGFSGIGPKVTDCFLLFSMERLDAYPVDVWVRRFMYEWYLKKPINPSEYNKISNVGRKMFGKYCGYAQEYLFTLYRYENDPNFRDYI